MKNFSPGATPITECQKQQSIHNQAHTHATTLVAVEREKEEKENRSITNMVIAQVEGEFKVHGFCGNV
jgi:hypothetical protein